MTPPRTLADVALERRCPSCRAFPLEDCRGIPAGFVHGSRMLTPAAAVPPPLKLTRRGRVAAWAVVGVFLAAAAWVGANDAIWSAMPWAVTTP